MRIEFWARVEWARLVDDLSVAQALAPFHILKPEIVEERFHYAEPAGVNVALLRVYRLSRPWDLPMRSAYGGCRSWVTLPAHDEAGLESVLRDEAFAEIAERLGRILGAMASPRK